MPLCLSAESLDVRTSRIIHLDHMAMDVQIF